MRPATLPIVRSVLWPAMLSVAPREACIASARGRQGSPTNLQALQEMVWSGEWAEHVAVIEQRSSDAPASDSGAAGFNLNTFLRWSHYNAERDETLRFDTDARGSAWLTGDFAGHCSGLSPLRRALCVAVLVGQTVK